MLSYNYIYTLNAWLLLSPWWLCFDWSMGCVQLVESLADPRLMSVVAFWATFGALGVYVLLGKPTEFKRLIVVFCTLAVPCIGVVLVSCINNKKLLNLRRINGKLGGAWEQGCI